MLYQIGLITEILATIIGLYCIYGKRFRLNVKTTVLTLGILCILECVNYFGVSGLFSCIAYLVLGIYCKYELKSSLIEVAISFILCMIIITSMQFVCMFVANVMVIDNVALRNLISNSLILIIFIVWIPKCELHKLQQNICKRKKTYASILLLFMGGIAILMLLQGKHSYVVQMQYFAFTVPAILLLLYSIVKCFKAQTEAESMKKEVDKARLVKDGYEDLLTKVRLHQHEFKNHITAIFSTHYMHKTYDKLVVAQEEYCKRLVSENQYQSLLLLGDNILAGFLYGKFQEAEEDKITVNYKVAAQIENMQVPTYYVIEMLGILLDNAVDALKPATEKIISFEVYEKKKGYLFLVKNPFDYVTYDEILEWFQLEKSSKGKGRGLGLYHLKQLCEKWECDIGCKNEEINHQNWIVFSLTIKKADGK
ncbi:MAG: GHKL domain-containing protein [Lachnospiraceae bacterium]|nr:GHKL domain-containing protein [Lachnospiraceae bacterium]